MKFQICCSWLLHLVCPPTDSFSVLFHTSGNFSNGSLFQTSHALHLYSFWASLLHLQITWLILSSDFSHILYVLLCWVLSILALILFVFIAYSCAAIIKASGGLFKHLLCNYLHLPLLAFPVVCLTNCLGSCYCAPWVFFFIHFFSFVFMYCFSNFNVLKSSCSHFQSFCWPLHILSITRLLSSQCTQHQFFLCCYCLLVDIYGLHQF